MLSSHNVAYLTTTKTRDPCVISDSIEIGEGMLWRFA